MPPPGKPFEPSGELPLDPWWRAIAVPSEDDWATVEPAKGRLRIAPNEAG